MLDNAPQRGRVTRAGVLMILPVLLLALGCSGGVPDHAASPRETPGKTRESCTTAGDFVLRLSVNGSAPALPAATQGVGYTPRIRLSGIDVQKPPATADLSITGSQFCKEKGTAT
jgi:hypothetical protein